MNAIEKLERRIKSSNSLLCVGLDPDLKKIPSEFTRTCESPDGVSREEATFRFLAAVIDLTAESACCFKLQKAFYDSYDSGTSLLSKTVGYIRKNYPEIPVFIDAKIGDIPNTLNAYMQTLFDKAGADGVVVNPYMGDDIFEFAKIYSEKAFIVLVRTSNEGSGIIQDAKLADGRRLWEYVLDLSTNRWNSQGNIMVVLSSRYNADYLKIREEIPENTYVLVVGIGVQGGSLETIKPLLNKRKDGLIINSSRGILYPYEPEDLGWRDRIRLAAESTKESINAIRS